MPGMKEGPGDDPFTDDDEETTNPSEPTTERESTAESDAESTGGMSTDQIPYVVRRQTVKEERNNEHVAFLRDEYADMENEVLAAVADELDMHQKEISVTDLREAFVELAAENPESVARILEDWGYEHLK
jgi:hypothetical protein